MSTIELLRAELIASKEELALKDEATRSRIRDILELRKEVERLEAQLSISDKARAEAWQQLAEANAVLDEASPLMQCARCRKESRAHTMMPEEGDEWECMPCWHEQNAKERAALAAERSSSSRCELCGCSVPKGAAYCSECWLPP